MKTFHIVTIFPDVFEPYFSKSILGRARKNKLIETEIYNLRDWTRDKHKTVDDTPYGGGAGMILKVEPIFWCVEEIKKKINPDSRTRVILFSAKGKKYTQRDAERLADYNDLILICGRYEGVDERVAEHIADEEISIGDYVLTGGELPAMALVDSVSRLIPGVLGNLESLSEESFSDSKFENENSKPNLEYPQYTKPAEFNGWKVPEILLSGHHKEIEKWKNKKKS